VPVLASSLEAPHLESRLVGLLREHRDGTIRVHACLAVTSGRGILITGESGTGKTSAALRLAGEAGGAWIADDAVELFLREGSVRGSAPVRTRGLVDLPGRGILRAAALLVPERILEEAGVDGVVRVVRRSSDPPPEWPEVTRRGTCRILGLERPFQVFATEEGCEPLERRIAGWASSLDPRRREA